MYAILALLCVTVLTPTFAFQNERIATNDYSICTHDLAYRTLCTWFICNLLFYFKFIPADPANIVVCHGACSLLSFFSFTTVNIKIRLASVIFQM
jgi:hypothetical protein